MPPKRKELRRKLLSDGSLRLSIPCFNQLRGDRLNDLKKAPYDVKLHVGPEKLPVEAHKKVLSAEIPYFSAMFSGNFQESSQEIIELPCIESNVPVQKLMTLFYKGTFTVTTEDVQELFIVCDLWGLDSIKQHCVEFMIQEIDCCNCFDLLGLGEIYSVQKIVDVCRDLISREFQIISQLDSFVELPCDVLLSLVQRSDLSMGQMGEDGMLKAVTRWLRHNWPLREQHIEGLLPHFRYSRCSQEVRDDFVSLSPSTMKHVVEEKMKPYIHNEPHWIWLPSDFEPTRKRRENIIVFCGHSHTRSGPFSPKLSSVELFNVDTHETRTVDLPEAPSYGAAFNLMGRVVYFAVSVHTDPATKKPVIDTHIYTFRPEQPVVSNLYRSTPDVFSKEARDCITRCLTSKGCVAHCPVKNRIYTITVPNVDCIKVTCSNGEILCEYEKPLQNLKGVLNDNHVGMGGVCCRGKLYVMGGRWGPELELYVSRDLYVLDEEGAKWDKNFLTMNKCRSDFAVASVGGCIYVSGGFGGYDHPKRLRDCERFDPMDSNWYTYSNMRQHKTHHCLVAANKELYAIGGKTYSSHKIQNAVEGEWLPGGARIVSTLIEKDYRDRFAWDRFARMKKGRCMFSAIAY